MKIIITGGCGFVGSHLTEYFSNSSEVTDICVIDKLTYAANREYIKGINCKVIIKDLNDLCVNDLSGYDAIINAAAESHVDNSFINSKEFTKTNTLGLHNLLEQSLRANVSKFVHISTDEVYGENLASHAFDENSPLRPTNPYSASKAAADLIALSYKKCFKMNLAIIRSNNIYGTRQYPEKLIPRSILRLSNGHKAVLHGEGNNFRSFLHVKDFCKAVDIILNDKSKDTIFNISSSCEYKNIDIIKMICSHLSLDFDKNIIYEKDRLFNDKRYLIDCGLIKRLGWSQTYKLENEIDDIISWYKQSRFFKSLQ